MVRTEIITLNGVQYVRNWSDQNKMIQRDGALYSEAIDPLNTGRIYTESDEPIETKEPLSEIEEKAAAYDILTGVRE